jgi:hypothetical protein
MRMKQVMTLMVATLVVCTAGCSSPKSETSQKDSSSEHRNYSVEPYSSYDYAKALASYVDEQGMVNYSELKTHSQNLDAYLARVGHLAPVAYDQWTRNEKIAFWINVYNGMTLKAILDHYPIQSSLLRSVLYPQNSIRQIPGVWDKWQFLVMGRQMTLNEIEHGTLRKHFSEPRIHLALVCASKGCPALRNEPYRGEHLDPQLHDQARRFLANPQKFHIDRGHGRVSLSPIFNWFGEDFVRSYGTQKGFPGKNPAERAVLNFISQYLGDANRDYLASGNYKVQYLDYDWSLNEQAGRQHDKFDI